MSATPRPRPYALNVPMSRHRQSHKGIYIFAGFIFLLLLIAAGMLLTNNKLQVPQLPAQEETTFFQSPIDAVVEENGPIETDSSFLSLSSNGRSSRGGGSGGSVSDSSVSEESLASLLVNGPIGWGNRPIATQEVSPSQAPQLPLANLALDGMYWIIGLIVLLALLWVFSKNKKKSRSKIVKRKVKKKKRK